LRFFFIFSQKAVFCPGFAYNSRPKPGCVIKVKGVRQHELLKSALGAAAVLYGLDVMADVVPLVG
jgi:hypothetical protein